MTILQLRNHLEELMNENNPEFIPTDTLVFNATTEAFLETHINTLSVITLSQDDTHYHPDMKPGQTVLLLGE